MTAGVIGLALHRATGPVPNSLSTLGTLALVPLVAAIYVAARRSDRLARWLSGVPLAVASTTAMLVLAVVGGWLPAATFHRFGLPSLWGSWPFALIGLIVATNLAATIGRRIVPLTYRNVLFLCSHLGLLVVLVGGTLSSVLLDRRSLTLQEGVANRIAVGEDGSLRELPFAATLREFTLENFPPTLAYVRVVPGKEDLDVTAGSALLKTDLVEAIGPVRVRVLEYLPKAVDVDGEWRPIPWKTAVPAARILVEGSFGRAEGWVSCGGLESNRAILRLGEHDAIAMPPPNPRRFRSVLEVERQGRTEKVEVEVNRPANVAGLQLYQLSYDERMGTASETSVIEVVEDRGVPVVYAGIALLLAGAALHLFEGTKRSKEGSR
ncbi:MAG: hypothetical protein KIS66_13555 [Fimbriimonadaceae bacterium]|nr:hypothetical protein [Fimbriimonadaceae bacterium]